MTMTSFMQAAPSPMAGSGANSTGVFLGNPSYGSYNNVASPSPQVYAQQLPGTCIAANLHCFMTV